MEAPIREWGTISNSSGNISDPIIGSPVTEQEGIQRGCDIIETAEGKVEDEETDMDNPEEEEPDEEDVVELSPTSQTPKQGGKKKKGNKRSAGSHRVGKKKVNLSLLSCCVYIPVYNFYVI